jgi:hypothetical protein
MTVIVRIDKPLQLRWLALIRRFGNHLDVVALSYCDLKAAGMIV